MLAKRKGTESKQTFRYKFILWRNIIEKLSRVCTRMGKICLENQSRFQHRPEKVPILNNVWLLHSDVLKFEFILKSFPNTFKLICEANIGGSQIVCFKVGNIINTLIRVKQRDRKQNIESRRCNVLVRIGTVCIFLCKHKTQTPQTQNRSLYLRDAVYAAKRLTFQSMVRFIFQAIQARVETNFNLSFVWEGAEQPYKPFHSEDGRYNSLFGEKCNAHTYKTRETSTVYRELKS